jgi:hypothetical protein
MVRYILYTDRAMTQIKNVIVGGERIKNAIREFIPEPKHLPRVVYELGICILSWR